VHDYTPRLRVGQRFSHTTALALWGAPLPARVEKDIHVTTPGRQRRVRTVGVIGHRAATATAAERGGVPVSPAATAFLESASILTLDELVAVGDYLILDPRQLDPADFRPYVPHAVLLSAVRQTRRRGIVRAREAAELVRPGVESPMETRLRLLVGRAGLPEPVCGYALRLQRDVHIGYFDLAWPTHRVIVEYDGDQHRTSVSQYERDIVRFERATEAGWRVIRVRARGLTVAPAATVVRISDALRRGARGQKSIAE
jgi:very-short-patch-repair endonuclease